MSLFVKNLIKNYSSKKALNKVSFNLKKSQIIGLLGPNGAGKTTLMKILSGSILDWEGTIKYKGFSLPKDINKFKQKIGYLPASGARLVRSGNPFRDMAFSAPQLRVSARRC